MKNITVKLNDENTALLQNEAKESNITLDEMVNKLIEAHFKEKQRRFDEARKYVRNRYRDLYKRLA